MMFALSVLRLKQSVAPLPHGFTASGKSLSLPADDFASKFGYDSDTRFAFISDPSLELKKLFRYSWLL